MADQEALPISTYNAINAAVRRLYDYLLTDFKDYVNKGLSTHNRELAELKAFRTAAIPILEHQFGPDRWLLMEPGEYYDWRDNVEERLSVGQESQNLFYVYGRLHSSVQHLVRQQFLNALATQTYDHQLLLQLIELRWRLPRDRPPPVVPEVQIVNGNVD